MRRIMWTLAIAAVVTLFPWLAPAQTTPDSLYERVGGTTRSREGRTTSCRA
jgi:hypothetical protein